MRFLPRLSVGWLTQPELFQRYWDTLCSTVEESASAVAASELPAAPKKFSRTFVNDAASNVFGTVVTGGGGLTVPVYFDGSSWRVG